MTDYDKEFREIEDKLKQFPKIEDQRTKEEVYTRVMAKIDQPKKRVYRMWYIPAVAVLLLIVLLANFLQPFNEPNDVAIYESNPVTETNETEEVKIFTEKDTLIDEQMNYVYAVREHDVLDDRFVVTIPYLEPTKTLVVPISFIIENNEEKLAQIEEMITHFDPHFFGLEHTFLKDVRLKEMNDEELLINIPSNKLLEQHEEDLLYQSMDQFAESLHYERVIIEGIEQISTQSNKYGYFLYTTNTGQTMLVPISVSSATFAETLEKMQETSSEIYQPAIPKDIRWVIKEEEDYVKIEFDDVSDVNDSMIEAILLTARSFGIEYVEFANLPNEVISRYDFTERISTKLAPNGM